MLKARLEKFNEKIICEDLILIYNFKNISEIPTFERAIIDSTSKWFPSQKFSVLQCFSWIVLNTGQRPVNRRSNKSLAFFNIRKGNLLGLKVTLRKSDFYNMLDKLCCFVLPKMVSGGNDKSINTETTKAIVLENRGLCDEVARNKKTEIAFRVSSQHGNYFAEISQLLLFFNSITSQNHDASHQGFSLNCSISSPTLLKNRKLTQCILYNRFLETNTSANRNTLKKQFLKQFLSAFSITV